MSAAKRPGRSPSKLCCGRLRRPFGRREHSYAAAWRAHSSDRLRKVTGHYPAWLATRAAGPLIRKAAIQRFPYLIAFEKHEQHVLILAVAHAKRRPLYWLTRVNP